PTLQGVAFARRAGEFGFRRRGEWGCGSRKAETKSRLSRPGGPRHYGGRRGESTRRRLRAGGPPSHGLLDVQANSGFGGRGEWGLRKPKSRDEISAQQAWRPAPPWRAARGIDEASIAGRGPTLPRVARRAGEFGFRRARGMGLRKPKSRDEISAQQAWRPAPLWRAARGIDEASIAGRGPTLPRVARRAGEFGFRRARGMGLRKPKSRDEISA